MGLGPPPTLIEHCHMRFVIASMPEVNSLQGYIQELKRYNTRRLVKVCEGEYDVAEFVKVGITFESMVFRDGSFPEPGVVERWLAMVKDHFIEYPRGALAVHCRSGLGRSAVLVAIALMECGMDAEDAVQTIRSKRRGCFNAQQYEQLMRYKPKLKLADRCSCLLPKILCCGGKLYDSSSSRRTSIVGTSAKLKKV